MTEIKKIASISMKTLGYSAKQIRKMVEEKPGQMVRIARIGGLALEYFTGESNYGEWLGFKGSFYLETEKGDKFHSAVAFLPTNVAKKLREQFDHGVVEVIVNPIDIFVQETDKNASGYAYVCELVASAEALNKVEKMALLVFSAPKNAQIENKTSKKGA